ncbi:MAG: trypsin-like peptidase domain-containing protein [Bacteroidetes bacterium]|nr:trypsin-like peptidase domain-containing protein [Bacteroidota bacterium]
MNFKLFPVVLTATVTSIATLFVAAKFQKDFPFMNQEHKMPVNFASYENNVTGKGTPPTDFETAATASVQAVVHIKTQTKARTVVANDPFFDNDFFGNMFGQRQYYIPPQQGSGSGVIVSPDGYIITNYHVISNAEMVTVTFNDRFTTNAKVVAKDASTDIALLKVEQKNLPYMEFGNSDDVRLGQWVLAVGYPLTLDATVTAGIVSAKSRAIGINQSQSASAIESFIQTDAAVNPGNSGGALVNTKGQLIGINSAIASPTGSYAGYSYAIPANIVRKVMNDLMKYGSIQRAFLGIEYPDPKSLTPEKVAQLGLDKNKGVYIAGVREKGGAFNAGLKVGDFISAVNGVAVQTETQLQEQIARYQPGDNVSVTYLRNGKSFNTTVELTNINGTTAIVKPGQINKAILLGATMKPLTDEEKKRYNLRGGVMITDISEGLISRQTNIRKGFVVLTVNGSSVNTPDDIQQQLTAGNTAQLAGFYPGNRGIYYYGIRLNNATDEQ